MDLYNELEQKIKELNIAIKSLRNTGEIMHKHILIIE